MVYTQINLTWISRVIVLWFNVGMIMFSMYSYYKYYTGPLLRTSPTVLHTAVFLTSAYLELRGHSNPGAFRFKFALCEAPAFSHKSKSRVWSILPFYLFWCRECLLHPVQLPQTEKDRGIYSASSGSTEKRIVSRELGGAFCSDDD